MKDGFVLMVAIRPFNLLVLTRQQGLYRDYIPSLCSNNAPCATA